MEDYENSIIHELHGFEGHEMGRQGGEVSEEDFLGKGGFHDGVVRGGMASVSRPFNRPEKLGVTC